jgi:hypothetical protein
MKMSKFTSAQRLSILLIGIFFALLGFLPISTDSKLGSWIINLSASGFILVITFGIIDYLSYKESKKTYAYQNALLLIRINKISTSLYSSIALLFGYTSDITKLIDKKDFSFHILNSQQAVYLKKIFDEIYTYKKSRDQYVSSKNTRQFIDKCQKYSVEVDGILQTSINEPQYSDYLNSLKRQLDKFSNIPEEISKKKRFSKNDRLAIATYGLFILGFLHENQNKIITTESLKTARNIVYRNVYGTQNKKPLKIQLKRGIVQIAKMFTKSND